MLFLDHAASTSMWDQSLDTLISSSRSDYANPSSSHRFGREVLKKIDTAREQLLGFLEAGRLYDLVFTSSATESNNMVIKGLNLTENDLVHVSEADHPSLLKPAESLARSGVRVSAIPMGQRGEIDIDRLIDSFTGREKLLILQFVNNQSGTINRVAEIASLAKKNNGGLHVHVDGVQGYCKIPFSLNGGEIDTFAVSSHKIGGPKGVAALYLKKNMKLEPLLSGGGQEGGMRSSTRPAPLILAFAEAVNFLGGRYENDLSYVAGLNSAVKENLSRTIPGIVYPFSGPDVSPYILNLIIPGISSDIVMRHLEQKDIFISTTSACSSGGKGENTVFRALGIEKKFHNAVYRVSFSARTTMDEAVRFCEELVSVYDELSGLL